jgi:hypothetical protein
MRAALLTGVLALILTILPGAPMAQTASAEPNADTRAGVWIEDAA